MLLTAIALDDEISALEVIETFAERTADLQLRKICVNPATALELLQQQTIDLLFLDINMPTVSGLEFAKQIPAHTDVIFTTAYTEHAVESYALAAIDYLLKPFTYQRFQQALEKVQRWRSTTTSIPTPLQFRVNYGIEQVSPQDIIYMEGLDNYVQIHFSNRKPLTVRLTLKELTKMLSPTDFMRVHRSFIIAIKTVRFVRNKTIYIGEKEIPLGGKYEEKFNKKFLHR